MNFNSKILKFSIVIALIFMLVPIVAAEDSTDSVYAQDESIEENNVIQFPDEMSDSPLTEDKSEDIVGDSNDDDLLGAGDENNEDGDDLSSLVGPVISSPQNEHGADLQITSFVLPKKLNVGEYALFYFVVANKGPDKATNVVAYANIYKGDVLYISSSCEKGTYDSYTGIWKIGDLESGKDVILLVIGKVLSDAPITTIAYVTSDTSDPDTSNNYYIDNITVESKNTVAAGETKTLPATGNPVIMAILAVLAIVGVSIGRRY